MIITDAEFPDENLVKLLHSWGYKTCYFSTNKSNDIGDMHPDLTIMDLVNDPNQDALNISKQLDSPIIYLHDVMEGLDVDYLENHSLYISKPVNHEKLKFAVEMVISHAKIDTKLKKNHDTYKLLYENAPLAYQSLDEDGYILEVNNTWIDKLGYRKEMVVNKWFGDFLDPKYVEKFKNGFSNFKIKGEVTEVEYELIKADNSRIPVLLDGKVAYDSFGNFKQTHCIFKDITGQKNAENALVESEKYYKTIFENTGTATIIVEEDSTISLVNTQFETLYGLKSEFIVGKKKWTDFVTNKYLPQMKEYHSKRRINPQNVPRNYEFDFIDALGDIKNIFVTVAIIPGTTKSLVSLQDITYNKAIENDLKISIKEKDTLLREIHHRVKNNLQIISSLLSLQSSQIEDKEALEVFKEGQNRVRSMAMIHEKLYKSDEMARINFSEYIKDLSESLFYNYHVEHNKIKLNTNIENIYFDVDTSIPCGLIVNELLTNCLKHAFPNNKNGEIILDLEDNQGTYILNVTDNGVGFPDNIDYTNTQTLGLQLVTNLVNQLDGTMELINNGGTSVTIQFKELDK